MTGHSVLTFIALLLLQICDTSFLYSAPAAFYDSITERNNKNNNYIVLYYMVDNALKVGFHYPSSRAEFTGRVHGPRTRVHFLTPVNSGRELG